MSKEMPIERGKTCPFTRLSQSWREDHVLTSVAHVQCTYCCSQLHLPLSTTALSPCFHYYTNSVIFLSCIFTLPFRTSLCITASLHTLDQALFSSSVYRLLLHLHFYFFVTQYSYGAMNHLREPPHHFCIWVFRENMGLQSTSTCSMKGFSRYPPT